ncbi:MAG: hypothetical protein SFY32_03515 [Bacteroidota bacterium]|nr:hypothetical protein [Bacteroidota bacterium]
MENISKYFIAEKYESLLFVIVGLSAISVAIYFIAKVKLPFYSGMAFPMIVIAFIQIVVGSSVYVKSSKDIVRVINMVSTDLSKVQKEEIPRMQTVLKNFILYKWIEIVLIAIGIVLFIYFPNASLLKGVGLGLFIQAGFMLILDLFAESRGKTYLEYLQNL